MAPVMEEKEEKDKRSPKMLCQMDNHLGRLTAREDTQCLRVAVCMSHTGHFVWLLCSFTLVFWQLITNSAECLFIAS